VWTGRSGKARQIAVAGRLTINNPQPALWAVPNGIGVAYVPEDLAAPFPRAGQLVRVFERWPAATGGLFVILSRTSASSDCAARFIDMVRAGTPGRSLKTPL
jgi:DNA-binding transcriptional LysR family regulator